jgi:hypothetical protein
VRIVTLDSVKRVIIIALIALGILVLYFVLRPYRLLGLGGEGARPETADRTDGSPPPEKLHWRREDRPNDGFAVEVPGEVTETHPLATTENGGTEPINMIRSSPGGDEEFAVAWADNPPVMRAADRNPDRTLDMARDGAAASTQTTIVNESRNTSQRFPARDFVARNVNGGVLDSRLVYTGQRLYMLIATYPSMSARQEQDIDRFFNSFAISSSNRIPETLPPATVVAHQP